MTGFKYDDPSPKACAWRILYLESIAGVPGMVSACLRHFRSLRCLQRDHGWIHTLLEEAENERMHLLIGIIFSGTKKRYQNNYKINTNFF